MCNVARRELGYPVDPAWNDEYLGQIEEDYLGDGWYGDGETGSVDWYNSFVLHPEMLFWLGSLVSIPKRSARGCGHSSWTRSGGPSAWGWTAGPMAAGRWMRGRR